MPDSVNQLVQQGIAWLPRLIYAIGILIVAWIIARLLKAAVARGLAALRLDERMRTQGLSNTLADLIYWLVFLIALPAVLGVLGLTGLLVPVQTMVNQILFMLPNILAAVLILVIGLFAARVVRRVVTDLLSALGVDRIGARAGVTGGQQGISGLLGMLAYALVLLPVLAAALDALNLPSLTQPVSNMLNQILAYLPGLLGAVLIIGVAYFIGRLVGGIVSSLLAGVGFDNLLARLGVSDARAVGGRPLSTIVGDIVMVAIVLFATIPALQFLRFDDLIVIVNQFLALAARVLLALVILFLGVWLANGAYNAIRTSNVSQRSLLANLARAAILILAGAMALSQTGLAAEIVNLAFGLLLGAVAVAAAIAFGLGGRDAAARVLEDMRRSVEEAKDEPPPPPAPTPRVTGPSTPPAPPTLPPTA